MQKILTIRKGLFYNLSYYIITEACLTQSLYYFLGGLNEHYYFSNRVSACSCGRLF